MKIAILGYGTVGSGVGEILTTHRNTLSVPLELVAILERKEQLHRHPLMCDNIESILCDPEIEAVVETMGGIEPAHTYILRALKAGKHVVSANKAVISRYAQEFHNCAKEHGVSFLYEASCGGGIPWLHQLHSVKRIDEIDEIEGIFNGTSNYILDHMTKESQTFQHVLRKAQELGYAEADPSADIDGMDILNKLRISIMLAFDTAVAETIPVFGIRNIQKADLLYPETADYVLKLLAVAKRSGNHYDAVVEPTLCPLSSPQSAVRDHYNLTCLHGTTIGKLCLLGQGAGKFATAHAIVQDLTDIVLGTAYDSPSFAQSLTYDGTILRSAYIIRTTLGEPQLQSILGKHLHHCDTFAAYTYAHTDVLYKAKMHQLMKEIVNADAQAFLMALAQMEE